MILFVFHSVTQWVNPFSYFTYYNLTIQCCKEIFYEIHSMCPQKKCPIRIHRVKKSLNTIWTRILAAPVMPWPQWIPTILAWLLMLQSQRRHGVPLLPLLRPPAGPRPSRPLLLPQAQRRQLHRHIEINCILKRFMVLLLYYYPSFSIFQHSCYV